MLNQLWEPQDIYSEQSTMSKEYLMNRGQEESETENSWVDCWYDGKALLSSAAFSF